MTPVHYKNGLLMDYLKAAGPADGVDPVLHIPLIQLPAQLTQLLHCLQGHGGVFQLVLSQQRQSVMLSFIREALAVDAVELFLNF